MVLIDNGKGAASLHFMYALGFKLNTSFLPHRRSTVSSEVYHGRPVNGGDKEACRRHQGVEGVWAIGK